MRDRVNRLCAERGISVAELERRTGVKAGTIKKWNKSKPTIRTAMPIAHFFGLTIDEFLDGAS